MDIEPKLREMLVLKDPGTRFTDNVLARVGDVPVAQARDGVVRLADARAGRRGRRMLLGALVVLGAAAATLPFLPGRGVDAPEAAQAAVSATAAGGTADRTAAGDSGVPVLTPDPGSSVGGAPLDCIDPDVLHGLLLPGSGQAFRVVSVVPPALADFKPPRQLIWLGGTERGLGAGAVSSAVYRTDLAPEAARRVVGEALTSGGWEMHSDDRYPVSSVFASATSRSVGQTYCRDGQPVTVGVNSMEGVNYVVLSLTRMDPAAGFSSGCDRPPQPAIRNASPVDEHLPTLELPRDPATGQPVAMSGSSGSGSVTDTKRRASASFRLKASVGSVADHFAGQMAAQGWQADATWSGAGTAGSTWTRRLDGDSFLQGMLSVSGFEDDQFMVVFHTVLTR